MNTQLVVPQQQNIVVGSGAPQLPMWRVDRKTGEFVHAFGIKAASIVVVVLGVQTTRMYWPEKYQESNQPLCGSYDMVTPNDRNTKYGTGEDGAKVCHSCPMMQFKEEGGVKVKPPCAEVYNALIVDTDNFAPGVMAFMRTRSTTGRNLMQFWRFMGKAKTVRLTTKQVTGKSGEWFAVNFQIEGDITPEVKASMAEYMAFMGSNFAEATSEEYHHEDVA